MTTPTLLLVDGFNLLSRGYFATAYGRRDDQLKNSKGIYTNALRVFFQKLFNLSRDHGITHIAVAWDVKRNETARRMKYDFYKGTRGELPEALIQQYETCTALLEAIGISQLAIAPYEADDVIGTLAARWSSGACYIYSNDRDLFQLLSDRTSQIVAGKQGDAVYRLEDFAGEYGLTAQQWIDLKALLGDTSDNIPGCPGIGPKSALPLLHHYGSLEQLYEQLDQLEPQFARHRKKLLEGKETAIISKELSAICCEIPELSAPDWDAMQLRISRGQLMHQLEELELKLRLDFLTDAV